MKEQPEDQTTNFDPADIDHMEASQPAEDPSVENDSDEGFSEDEFTRRAVAAMLRVGVPSAVIFAFMKTGRIACDQNWHLLTPAEKREWTRAVREYSRYHPDPDDDVDDGVPETPAKAAS